MLVYMNQLIEMDNNKKKIELGVYLLGKQAQKSPN